MDTSDEVVHIGIGPEPFPRHAEMPEFALDDLLELDVSQHRREHGERFRMARLHCPESSNHIDRATDFHQLAITEEIDICPSSAIGAGPRNSVRGGGRLV